MTTESDDDFDALTPKQQRAAIAKFVRAQKQVQTTIKRNVSDVAAFVRAHGNMVIEMKMDERVMMPGQINRAVLHLEMEADTFARFMAKRLHDRKNRAI